MKVHPYRTTLISKDSDDLFRLMREADGEHLIVMDRESHLPIPINRLFPIRIVKNGAWYPCGVDQATKYRDRIEGKFLVDVLGRMSAVPAWPVAALRHEFTWARYRYHEFTWAGCEKEYSGAALSKEKVIDNFLKQWMAEPKEKLLALMAEIVLTNGDRDVRQAAQIALEGLA